MQLQHLKHKAIDKQLWDEKICASVGHLPYAESWYLDIVSPGWEAIVSENYDYVMPLPLKRKFKIGYLVQPHYTQQLGIFSKEIVNQDIISEFLSTIPYKSYQFNLNENNIFENAVVYPNYVLDLNKTYSDIYKNFGKNTQRNIEKALKLKVQIEELSSKEELFEFINGCEEHQPVKPNKIIHEIIEKGIEHKKISMFGVRNNQGKLIASCCFLVTEGRLVYLHPVSDEEGKKASAMFALVDFVIRKFAGTATLLDFEGSRIEGVARFYKGFGTENRPYFVVRKFRPYFLTGKI